MIGWMLLFLFLSVGVGFLYWLVVLTEGAYLGPRAVTFLYDRGAGTYDRVKDFDALGDAWDLAMPLQRTLKGVEKPLVLDVATGTGRLPLALLRSLDFDGHIVGLDISLRMLQEARRKTAGHDDRVTLVWKDALTLPFADEVFDAVSCVEALEFMANPRQSLEEMIRVLKSGGALLLTNRVGFDAFLMPGRAFSDEQFKELLAPLSIVSAEIKEWQTYYDLIWAKKEGNSLLGGRSEELEDIFCCPWCLRSPLESTPAGLSCDRCDLLYPVERGIVYLQRPLGK
jgi:ubiquinone/menaquinone biosynthesis C-methylase UbiE